MHNITLICSAHREIGKCNPDELYKIIESIDPEVIFEELSDHTFDLAYNQNYNPNKFIEIRCIQKYMQNHSIKHFPVDIEPSPDLSDNEIDYMFSAFNKYNVYNNLVNERILLTEQNGFAYLNSKICSDLFDKMKAFAETTIMQFDVNKNSLLRIHKLYYEEVDNRENKILQNIYNYSKDNQYNQAVFLIGAGHRNSIKKKIIEQDTSEKLKLSWKYYNAS